MPPRPSRPLTLRNLQRLPAGSEAMDPALPGFGVRAQQRGGRVRRQYFIRWKDPRTGKRRRKILGYHGETLTLELARAEARNALREVLAGRPLPSEPGEVVRVANLVQRFLEEHARVRCRLRTLSSWRSLFNKHVLPVLGDTPVSEVTTDDIRRLHAAIGAKTYRGRRTTGAANRVLSLLHNLFNWAEVWSWRPPNSNPARRGVRGIIPFEERSLGRVLRADERARLIEVIREHASIAPKRKGHIGPHYAALFETMLWCPARRGELLELDWTDVRLSEGARLRVRISKTKAKSIPIPVQLVEVLERHRQRFGGQGRVFATASGKRLLNVHRVWTKVRHWAGLDTNETDHAFRLHDFRHTMLSEMIETGESLYLAGRAGGHARLATTERYVHVRDRTLEQALQRTADRLDAELPRDDASTPQAQHR